MASVGLPNYGTQNAVEKFPGIQQPDRPFSGMLKASYLGLWAGDKARCLAECFCYLGGIERLW